MTDHPDRPTTVEVASSARRRATAAGVVVVVGLLWLGGAAAAQEGEPTTTSAPQQEASTTTAPEPDAPAEAEPDAEPDVVEPTTTSAPAATTTSTSAPRPATTTPPPTSAAGSGLDEDEGAAAPLVEVREDNPLLVPGPERGATEALGAAATPEDEPDEVTDDVESEPTGDADDDAVDEDDSAETTVRRVMYALIGVAVLLTALTVYYWWITRPGPTGTRSSAREGRRSRGRAPEDPSTRDDGGTVEPWQTDSTSTR